MNSYMHQLCALLILMSPPNNPTDKISIPILQVKKYFEVHSIFKVYPVLYI